MTLPISPGTLGALQWPRRNLAPRGAYLLFGGVVSVIAVVSLLPGLIGPSLDAAVFSVVGERVASGALPYVDIFDHKPPGLYLMIAAGQLLGGSIGAWKVAWILSVGSVALTGVIVADTLRHLGWRGAAWAAGALCAAELASFPLALGGGLGETAAVLPAAAALRLVLVGPRNPNRRLGAGLLAGLAAAISLQAAPVLLATLIADAVRSHPLQISLRGRIVGSLWVATGAAATWAILVVMLGSAGATAAAFNAIVGYNEAYRNVAGMDDGIAAEATHAVLVLGPLTVAAVAGLPRALRRGPMRAAALASLAWLGSSLVYIAIQGRLEIHYTTLMVVPLALLAAPALHLTIRGTRAAVVRTALLAGFMIAALTLSAVLVAAETAVAMNVRSAQAHRSDAVASWVSANVPETGRIFVWGNRPELYLDIPREPASEYVYLLPLTTPGYVTGQTVERVRLDFLAHPPAVIVDAGSAAPGEAGLPPLLIERATAALDGRNADILDPLREYIRANYRLATIVDGWPIYVPR